MKITAHFESPDSADLAAGALKRALSPLSKIETENLTYHNDNLSINIFPVFNLLSSTPSYSVPVKTNNLTINNPNDECNNCILHLICRKEDAATASRIIIGFGGRNITKI